MYYDLLPKLKNAIRAQKESIRVPYSKMDLAVLKVLVERGYVKSAEKETAGRKQFIGIRLAYKDKQGAMSDFKLLSKPSRHVYADYRSLRPVRQGHGFAVLSTSRGVMSDKEARKAKVGGEYLFQIW